MNRFTALDKSLLAVFFVIAVSLAFLLGVEAGALDARNHGVPAPHLWERF